MTNKLSFADIEVQVEDYTFLVKRAYKTLGSEQFSLRIKNRSICLLKSYNENSKLNLSSYVSFPASEASLIDELNKRKDFLIKFYTAIRNHPSCRLILFH